MYAQCVWLTILSFITSHKSYILSNVCVHHIMFWKHNMSYRNRLCITWLVIMCAFWKRIQNLSSNSDGRTPAKTKPVLNQINGGHSKCSNLYEHSINGHNGVPKYQQPNHYGFPAMACNKSNRPEYQKDAQELRIATIAALSQQIKGKKKECIASYRVMNLVSFLAHKFGYE